jgi:hypothetical protein
MRQQRWAQFLIFALLVGWFGGLATPAGAAAPRADRSADAADNWALVGGSLAITPLAAGVGSRAVAVKALGASQPTSSVAPLVTTSPPALDRDGQAPGRSALLIYMPLRC